MLRSKRLLKLGIFLLVVCQPGVSWSFSAGIPVADSLLTRAEVLLRGQSLDSALALINQAKALPNKSVDSQARIYGLLGHYFYRMSLMDSVSHYNEQAAIMYGAAGRPCKQTEALMRVAIAHEQRGDFKSSQLQYYDALEKAEHNKCDSLKDRLYINLSTTYLQMGDHATHKKYMLLAHGLAQKYGHRQNECIALQAISAIFLRENQTDSAINILEQALELAQELGSAQLQAYVQLNLGKVHAESDDSRASQYYYGGAHTAGLPPFDSLRLQYHYFKHLVEIKEYQKVQDGLPDLITLCERTDAGDIRLDLLELQFQAQAGLGNYRNAFLTAEEFMNFNDSIFNRELTEDLSEMNAKYETEVKEKQNETLRAESAERALAISKLEKKARRRQWVATLLAAMTLGVIAVMYFLRKSSRQAQIIYGQNTKIKDQQLETLRIDKELASMQAMFEGEEKERRRVASDLHDAIGGMLSSIKLQLGRDSENPNSQVRQASLMVDKVSREVRRISQNLMPNNLDKFGLVTALEDLCDEMSSTDGTQFEFQEYHVQDGDWKAVRLAIYRIVQELMNNVIKHANANESIVQLTQNDEGLTIVVEDSGSGFPNEEYLDPEAYQGLTNIQNRLNFLRGKLEIESDQQGSTVRILIPFQHDQVTHR